MQSPPRVSPSRLSERLTDTESAGTNERLIGPSNVVVIGSPFIETCKTEQLFYDSGVSHGLNSVK